MDSLNLLIEYGADLKKKHKYNMNCFDEIVRTDNFDLFQCVYEHTKGIKRNLKEVLSLQIFIYYSLKVFHYYIMQQEIKATKYLNSC
jgi:hypothetical protein